LSFFQKLRILRHPNILKFLECETTPDVITMVTEPVAPLLRTLKEMSLEGVVMGWRGVGAGLSFLHDKVGMSHNNVWPGCVYVNTLDSQWKVGGLETAARHKDISTTVRIVCACVLGCVKKKKKKMKSTACLKRSVRFTTALRFDWCKYVISAFWHTTH